MSLADIQLRLRRAVVTGDLLGVAPLLVGGRDTVKRVAIHRRHYQSSLVSALLGKFPATSWLVGTPFIAEAARRFVCEQPPRTPCIAEYGEGFPEFLSTRPAGDRVPYLRAFAELEWHVGGVSVAVDRRAVTLDELNKIEGDALTEVVLVLQPGVRYLQAQYPVDHLMKLYLTDTAPDRLTLAPADVRIEVRGARGDFHINRLDAGQFVFRKAVLDGRSIGAAAEDALDADAAFDPGRALSGLVGDRLVTAIARRVRSGEEA